MVPRRQEILKFFFFPMHLHLHLHADRVSVLGGIWLVPYLANVGTNTDFRLEKEGGQQWEAGGVVPSLHEQESSARR